ncbi:sensor histidine kinase [Brevibacillus massiliensis]|uniref:sensor histidine kinase n=1 Tax=Brevibacillus massiliensis TaxID=1118054 RepID=UPI0002DB9283|nr:histidine kinase [Brevibacillus massiliensis]
MTYRKWKIRCILLPPLIIGGFEFIRHGILLDYLSMEAGNYYITLLTLLLSYIFATKMFQTIERMNTRLAELQARRAVYEERERLARELHDNIAQTLFLLNVKVKQGRLDEAKAAITEIDNNLRQAIFNLRSSPDEGVSLAARINTWLSEWSLVTGIEVKQALDEVDGFFSPNEEVQLFGVVQEAFTNIQKHSRASQAAIRLKIGRESWQLAITDNGRGIRQEDADRQRYGLTMIRERAEKLGASFRLDKAKAGGTELILTGGIRR